MSQGENNSSDLLPINITPNKYGERFRDHYFEQYKTYVEMADRVSARRVLANTFFLTVQTSIMVLFGVLLKDGSIQPMTWMLLPILGMEILCIAWWHIVKSYSQLNAGKFAVINIMEQKLPISPYMAEWNLLGKGKKYKLYKPITHVETWIPSLFGIMYIVVGLILMYYLKYPIP